MTVRIPQYTIENHTNKSYKTKVFLGFLLLFSGILVGYLSSNFYVKQSLSSIQERNDFLDTENLKHINTINSQLAEISILQTDNKVKTEALLQIQTQYQNLLKTIDGLNSNISFYEQLLNPSSNNKGLRVFKAQIKTTITNSYELTLSLAQRIERANNISGSLTIAVEGIQENKNKTINIDLNQQSKYKFKYFQTLSYQFSLPEGFKPERLVVELKPSSKKAKKVQNSYLWNELIKAAG